MPCAGGTFARTPSSGGSCVAADSEEESLGSAVAALAADGEWLAAVASVVGAVAVGEIVVGPSAAYSEGNCDVVCCVARQVVALDFVVDASAEHLVTVNYVAV
jgi:hypothetical protein